MHRWPNAEVFLNHCARFRMRHPTHAQQVGWVLLLTVLVVLALFRWLYGE